MKKDLLTLNDLTRDDLEKIFEFSTKLKQERGKVSYTPLAGKSIGLIFAKSSTRTRVSFEVGVNELGGTALYLLALLDGYTLPGGELPPRCSGQPRVKQNQDQANSFTPPFALDALLLGVYFPRAQVRERIQIRLDKRLEEGMIEEEKRLVESGVTLQQLEFFGLEYREMALYLEGKQTLSEMRDILLNKIRQFAKRQDIFFRKMEREGHVIHWLKQGNFDEAVKLIELFLQEKPLPPVEFKLCDIIN